MEDSVDKNESLFSLSNLKPKEGSTDEEKKSLSNGDEDVVSSSAVSTGEEEMAERNGEKTEDRKEENDSAGFIETVATKLGFASSSVRSTGKEEMAERNGEKKENGGVGIIETVASKLGFNDQNPSSKSNQEDGGEKNEGHGIIGQIMSKLPDSVDQAPAADEASLLISIIDD